jgi:sigma-B regulation protein RsbU (phosphoserine phosphatase)
VFIGLAPLALAYFGIIFPERLALDRSFPWIKWIAIGPMLVRAGLWGIVGGLILHHRDMILRLRAILIAVDPACTDIELGLIGLFFAILRVQNGDGDHKRCPPAVPGAGYRRGSWAAAVSHNADVGGDSSHELSRLAGTVSIAALLVFPLTMAYVIVVHRAMDVRVVTSRSLGHPGYLDESGDPIPPGCASAKGRHISDSS